MRSLSLLFLILLSSCYHTPVEEQIVAIQIQDRNGMTETISSSERLELYNHTDFLTAQPYKKVLRIFRSNGKSQSKITTYHPNGALWQYLEAEELRANGAYREWYPNGQQRIEAVVIGGPAEVSQGAQKDWLFHGISKVWNEQGKSIAELPYNQGVLEGKSIYYFPSGVIEKEQIYSNHVLDGVSIEYYPSGELRSKISYTMGAQDGLSIGYFITKEIAWEEEFKDDLLLHGSYFNSKGEILSEVKDGIGFKALFNGENLSHLVQIQQGFVQGGVKQFNAKGDIVSVYYVKNGKKIGTEIAYYLPEECEDKKTLSPKLSINWHDNSIHGCVKTWYPNGQMQSQRDFCHNKKMGPSLSWYRDGSLMLIEEYDEDKLVKGQYYKRNALDSISSVIQGSGIATLYDENGVFLRKSTYVKGEVVDPND